MFRGSSTSPGSIQPSHNHRLLASRRTHQHHRGASTNADVLTGISENASLPETSHFRLPRLPPTNPHCLLDFYSTSIRTQLIPPFREYDNAGTYSARARHVLPAVSASTECVPRQLYSPRRSWSAAAIYTTVSSSLTSAAAFLNHAPQSRTRRKALDPRHHHLPVVHHERHHRNLCESPRPTRTPRTRHASCPLLV